MQCSWMLPILAWVLVFAPASSAGTPPGRHALQMQGSGGANATAAQADSQQAIAFLAQGKCAEANEAVQRAAQASGKVPGDMEAAQQVNNAYLAVEASAACPGSEDGPASGDRRLMGLATEAMQRSSQVAGRGLLVTALPPAPEPAATQASLVSDSSAKAAVSAAKQLDCDTATADLRRAAASAIQTGNTKELRLVTDALGMVAAAGCPQQPILVLQPSAVSSWRSANSPRFIMGRKLRGLGLSVPDAISAAQGAGAAAKAGNCPQAVIALNLAQSSPDALTNSALAEAITKAQDVLNAKNCGAGSLPQGTASNLATNGRRLMQASASAGPGGATASASGVTAAAGVTGNPVQQVKDLCNEAVEHAQAGNCLAAQLGIMAARNALAQTTDSAAKAAYDAAVATIQTTSCGAAGFNQVQGPAAPQNGGAAAAASATSGRRLLRVATQQTATDSVTLAKMFVAQGKTAQASGISVAASTAFQRATGAYAMAAADFAAIGDCVKAFQTAADCRRNANMAVQNGAGSIPGSTAAGPSPSQVADSAAVEANNCVGSG